MSQDETAELAVRVTQLEAQAERIEAMVEQLLNDEHDESSKPAGSQSE